MYILITTIFTAGTVAFSVRQTLGGESEYDLAIYNLFNGKY